MKLFIIISGIIIIGCLIVEQRFAIRHRRALKHLVHVNGTRGKSGVTRLIAAGLREGGLKVYCKTTGTLPMTINCAGEEKEIKRRGPANISEQIKTLRDAASDGADVLVIECMAVNPELQYTCEHKILHSDIGVITNARIDHVAEMGDTLESVRTALANTIPKNGKLFTSDAESMDSFSEVASRLNTQVKLADTLPPQVVGPWDFPENIALALSVCEELGVDRETALRGFEKVKEDPYALSTHRLGEALFIDAMSANDPLSTELIIEKYSSEKEDKIYILNTRSDRGYRTNLMIDMIKRCPPKKVFVIGSARSQALRKLWRCGIPAAGYKDPAGLPIFKDDLGKLRIFAIGNIAGPGIKLMELIRKEETKCTEK